MSTVVEGLEADDLCQVVGDSATIETSARLLLLLYSGPGILDEAGRTREREKEDSVAVE